MTIQENKIFTEKINKLLDKKLPIKLGVNKRNEFVRLIYEICKRDDISPVDVLNRVGVDQLLEEGRGELFQRIKKALLSARYPSAEGDEGFYITPIKIDKTQKECSIWEFEFNPKNIFIEKSIKDNRWTRDFISQFPKSKITEVNSMKDEIKKLSSSNPVDLYNSRRDRVFLIKSKSTFVKICPCTKNYKRCGYWILNLGFGCPMDCSYCYLQMYSNAPGIVLPANIEDFYNPIKEFDKKLNERTRIGTGEFTDSLALDKFTRFSSHLVPFFAETKNLVLELKTKIADMDNILREEPNENVVISWTMNPYRVAEKYEKGAAGMADRIRAAGDISKRGFNIGFHFDPIIYSADWEEAYHKIVKEIFSARSIKKKTVWISLGTLRYTPGFKQTVEQRFSENQMFYEGEFFADSDGKLRYPRSLRVYMYNKMISWIRESGAKAWIYLCMEPEDLWRETILRKEEYSYNRCS